MDLRQKRRRVAEFNPRCMSPSGDDSIHPEVGNPFSVVRDLLSAAGPKTEWGVAARGTIERSCYPPTPANTERGIGHRETIPGARNAATHRLRDYRAASRRAQARSRPAIEAERLCLSGLPRG